MGGSPKNGTSHKNDENGNDSKDGESGRGEYSLSEPSVFLQDSCTFLIFFLFKEFRLQAIAIPL